ncbi:hypothetical protein SAMN05421800_10291 [Chryseobacterium balustinum]|uniref:Uncharacterized protein n=1 Tax=Chryseobacterium balustinum TaxID=246 RepID=A0AAX2IKZ6_9FLAO|nr:hypothetical protein SAMN05421800_10291 [Chryseobacterium balustinum]SQA89178.1 Uncharacterised protein [Chryseobacterium balustinum]
MGKIIIILLLLSSFCFGQKTDSDLVKESVEKLLQE